MALPETIAAKYSEEDAEYLTVRPVRRQTFRLDELIDMIVSVTGKDAARIQQILHSGTIVFHFYRYSWGGFDASGAELAALLARYPDPDPARPFRAEQCAAMVLESDGNPARRTLELERATDGRRRFLHRRSAWDALLAGARERAPEYSGYSYGRRADLYRRTASSDEGRELLRGAEQFASRTLRAKLARLETIARITYVCPRS